MAFAAQRHSIAQVDQRPSPRFRFSAARPLRCAVDSRFWGILYQAYRDELQPVIPILEPVIRRPGYAVD
jgi:hypothetical protein